MSECGLLGSSRLPITDFSLKPNISASQGTTSEVPRRHARVLLLFALSCVCWRVGARSSIQWMKNTGGWGGGVGQFTCSLAYCPEVDIFKLLELQEITFLREPPVRMTAFSFNLPSYFSRLTYPESHIHIHAHTVFYLMSLSLFKHSSGQDTLLE